jgi:hypothetical protein
MKKKMVYFPDIFEMQGYNFSGFSSERFVFTEEEIKKVFEDYTTKLLDNIGFIKTTSEELNSQEYRPFITDDESNIWIIDKEGFKNKAKEILKDIIL